MWILTKYFDSLKRACSVLRTVCSAKSQTRKLSVEVPIRIQLYSHLSTVPVDESNLPSPVDSIPWLRWHLSFHCFWCEYLCCVQERHRERVGMLIELCKSRPIMQCCCGCSCVRLNTTTTSKKFVVCCCIIFLLHTPTHLSSRTFYLSRCCGSDQEFSVHSHDVARDKARKCCASSWYCCCSSMSLIACWQSWRCRCCCCWLCCSCRFDYCYCWRCDYCWLWRCCCCCREIWRCWTMSWWSERRWLAEWDIKKLFNSLDESIW